MSISFSVYSFCAQKYKGRTGVAKDLQVEIPTIKTICTWRVKVKIALSLVSVFFVFNLANADELTHEGIPSALNVENAQPALVTKALSSASLGTYNGEKIEQEEPFAQAWNYLAPNEHYNHYFEGCLPKEGGAYISVGTFRGMNVASSGKVSHLFLMDGDSSANLFNKINLQLIAKAKDRFEYLSFLFTGKANPDLEDKARKGEMKLDDFFGALASKSMDSVLEDWKTGLGVDLTPQEWERFRSNISDPRKQFDGGDRLFSYASLASRLRYEFGNYMNVDNGGNTIFGNDTRFSKFQDMVKQGKVTVLTGSITGEKTLKSLDETLRRSGLKVAAMDVSNIPDYLNAPGLKQKSLENIRALPFREGGRLHFTNGGPITVDGWAYNSVNQQHLSGLSTYPYATTPYTSGDGTTHNLIQNKNGTSEQRGFYRSDDAPCIN